jgi:hypothetical protein
VLGLTSTVWLSGASRRLLLPREFQRVQKFDLVSQVVFLGPAALPAVSPIQDKKLETKGVDFDGRLEANAKIVVVHLIELGT